MIPLVAPTITGRDLQDVHNAIELGALENEREVRAFEEEFAAYVGCVGGVAVNSGTNALLVALEATKPDIEPGHPVVMPSFTCRALLDAFQAVDWWPTLCDNQCDVRAAVFKPNWQGRDAWLGVWPHMFGTGQCGQGLRAVRTIEDLTLSLGGTKPPEYGVCSFNRDKMISTGRGGMIVSQDQTFLERCRELAYYDQPRNGTYRPAFSFGMTAIQAALGRSQLRQLLGFIERRREIAARYTEAFSQAGIECPNPDVDSVFFRYVIGVQDPADKVAKLAVRGIEAGRGVNPPLHRLLGLDPASYPGAEECVAKLLSVPVHPGLADGQVEYIIEQVIEVCAP